MEETLVPKRPREEPQVEEKDLDFEQDYSSKKQKPYTHILSLLDSEEEDSSSTQDLSPLITTLQQEITSASNNEISQDSLLVSPTQENDQATLTTIHALENGTTTPPPQVVKEEEEEESDKERVMRHLLQASDDELGIPSSGDDGVFGFVAEDGFNSEHGFSSKLWELEDERANYYAFLQSELFLGGY